MKNIKSIIRFLLTPASPVGRRQAGSLFIILFLLAFLERTVFDLGPNFELLTTAMVLSAYFLGGKYSFWLTFLVIAISDRFIGNSKIFLFTWSGFLIPALFSARLINFLKLRLKLKQLNLIITGLSANFFFYIWTNLGVWLLDSWGLYSKDPAGLVRCYINALPFLKNQVCSSLIFIPLGVLLIETTSALSKKFQWEKRVINFLNRTGIYRI